MSEKELWCSQTECEGLRKENERLKAEMHVAQVKAECAEKASFLYRIEEMNKERDELRAEVERWKKDHADMEAWGKENLDYAARTRQANQKLRSLLTSARETIAFYAKTGTFCSEVRGSDADTQDCDCGIRHIVGGKVARRALTAIDESGLIAKGENHDRFEPGSCP